MKRLKSQIHLLILSLVPTFTHAHHEPSHGIIEDFIALKKAELHLHLGGSFPISYLKSIASPEDKKVLDTILSKYQGLVAYDECFEIFKIMSKLVNTEEKISLGTSLLCEELEKDNVGYAEIRTGLKDLGNGYEKYLESVLEGINKARTTKLKVKLLLSLRRSSTPAFAKETIDLALKYKKLGVIGIDISDHSTSGDIENISHEIKRAKKHGLFLAVHMGESPKETNQLKLLQSLKPDRIGHGVFLEEDAKSWILINRIPIEVCPSSSLCVEMVKTISEHPGLVLYKTENHPISICTDDPGVFLSSLSKELKILYDQKLFSFEEIKTLVENTFQQGFDYK